MSNYTVAVTETIVYYVHVQAETAEGAVAKVRKIADSERLADMNFPYDVLEETYIVAPSGPLL